jgi:U3 small nucleolar ribonucleoprotein component
MVIAVGQKAWSSLLFTYLKGRTAIGSQLAVCATKKTKRGEIVSKSRKTLSAYELRRARQAYDRRRIDKRTRVGRMALQAMQKRGRKSKDQRGAMASVGYPGY